MTAIPVTLVTRNASADSLTDADYGEIFAELRQQHSLAQLCELLQSKYSRALWNKYERGETTLTRTMRNELRRAVGLPLLPPTVAEAAAAASPDAAVWQVGTGPAEHVIMVASPEPLTLHVNARCVLPEPEDERQPEEPGSEPEQDSDHNATGETMDDFLNGLDADDN